MATFVFVNFCQTTLASPASSWATSITVASGTGAPTISAGQQWAIVLQSAATPSVREVVYVTAVSGTAFTVVRAQEGTTALSWSAADDVFASNTAGQMAAEFQTVTALGGDLSGTLPNPTVTRTYSGRLLNTLVYTNVSGTQYVSINGGATTTSGAGTYTPNAAMATVRVYGCGGGGPGGGATVPSGGNVSASAAGGGATFGEAIFTAATIGSSQTVTIGQAGAPASGAQGSTGGTTSLGTLLLFPGGTAGSPINNVVPPTIEGNGVPSAAATGANVYSSQNRTNAASQAISNISVIGGNGGDTPWGNGALGNIANTAAAYPASGYGAGGAGIVLNDLGSLTTGNAGTNWVLFIEEYT